MFNIKKISIALMLSLAIIPVFAQAPTAIKPQPQTLQSQTTVQTPTKVQPLDLVKSPNQFLNKKVVMDAKFDKFSTLGLDYKKAYKDSTKYIAFLIQRDDIQDHNVPLSELKLFIKREYAEKFVDLNTGDKISITGTVFSTALGDPWVDITSIQVLEKNPSAKQQ